MLSETLDYEGYFFDLDGTILLGDKLLPGAADALARLRGQGKKILFLSNTTTRTRAECCVRLRELGLEANVHEIVTAAYASAVYMRERRDAESEPRVLIIGEQAMADELDEQGIRATFDPRAATHVLVGMDRRFDYGKLHAAMTAVRNGAALIAANPDPSCPVEGDRIPDTWAIAKAIETAAGVSPLAVIGKPSAYYAAIALARSGLSGDRCLMVGDRPETDILFGQNNGMRTALVLTGVASDRDIARSAIRPDYVWRTLEELAGALRT